MNKSIARVALMTVVAAALTQVAVAQPEHLPSPHAEVSQTIGLSDVTVSFHRPGVKGREIWGDLVPYGAIWRAGANASTTLTFESDVKIGGETVKAGTYGLFVLPTPDEWTFILNTNTETNGRHPGEDTDVVRITATPEDAPHQERLVYSFEDLVDDKPTATIVLQWEKKKASFSIETLD